MPPPVVAPRAAQERDELEEYLSSPLETDMELDLLAYWKLKESTWPKLAQDGEAVLGRGVLVRRRGARLLGCRQDARRPAQGGER